MSEPARAVPSSRPPLEVRVGSATNALEPIPGAQRALAAGPAQWAALLVVAGAAAAADQLTKLVVAGGSSSGTRPGPRAAVDPPRRATRASHSASSRMRRAS